MVLNQQRQLWFCRNVNEEQPKWLLLSSGVLERKVSRKSSDLQFYKLGTETSPEVELHDSVKVISFLLHFDENDSVHQELLDCHGETLKIVQWDNSKNGEMKGKICDALVEITDDGSGLAEDPMNVKVQFSCGVEVEAELVNGVNGIGFTAKK